jgi:predicted kinase
MRKWMRERMKRRKPKSEPAEPTQAAPHEAPLQPAYFDSQEKPSERSESSAADNPPMQVEEPVTSEAESQAGAPAESESPSTAQSVPAGEGPRRRRRRGRGGRGRGQTRRQTPAAPLPPTLVAQPAVGEAVPQAAPPVPATPAAPRASKGVVVLAIGLPGSGKSSWFKRHNIRALSSDLLRDLLFDDPTEQRYQDLVFSNLRSMLKARMIARRPLNYVDATNLTPHDRHTWIKLARDYSYDVHAVFFDVPLEVCMERNQRRQRVVPEDAMRRMAAKFRPPTFEEGFSKITVVRVKKKEAAS